MTQAKNLSSEAGIRPRVAMVQDGARRRYAMPMALEHLGMLEAMYSDWFVRPHSKEALIAGVLSRLSPGIGKGMQDRRCDAIPARKVVKSVRFMMRMRMARRRFGSAEAFFAWEADERGEWIRRHWREGSNTLLGFVRNIPPELCAWARSRGVVTIADQIIAPAAIESRELALQHQRWPGWQKRNAGGDETTQNLEERTWRNLTHIICMSDYVREGLLELGIAPDRVSVIPYPFEASNVQVADRRSRGGPVTVGFTGKVGLRKGAGYFLEVAKRFAPGQVRFVMVGGSELEPMAQVELARHVTLVGQQPRAKMNEWLNKFDVFLFPSTCEGSAGSVMEAMAAELPVITTRNSGSLVRHGIDGYVVAYDNVDAMAAHVEELARDPERREAMGRSGRARIEQFNLEWYGNELGKLITRVLNGEALPRCSPPTIEVRAI